MTEPKIHISRAIWDKDTHEVAYIVDGVMLADVATQRKLNAVDDMYEALCVVKQSSLCESCGNDNCDECIIDKALRKARGEAE